MGKIRYVKCPRCELNYIPDSEEMCDICKAELGLDSKIVLLDDIIDADDEFVDELDVLERDEEPIQTDLDEDNDDEWRSYLDDDDTKDTDEEDEIPLDELKEMEEDDFDEDEEEEMDELDEEDFDYADPDDYTDEELDELDDEDDVL